MSRNTNNSSGRINANAPRATTPTIEALDVEARRIATRIATVMGLTLADCVSEYNGLHNDPMYADWNVSLVTSTQYVVVKFGLAYYDDGWRIAHITESFKTTHLNNVLTDAMKPAKVEHEGAAMNMRNESNRSGSKLLKFIVRTWTSHNVRLSSDSLVMCGPVYQDLAGVMAANRDEAKKLARENFPSHEKLDVRRAKQSVLGWI